MKQYRVKQQGGSMNVRFRWRRVGLIVAGAGVFIILALILPAGFWWFALGVALIAAGIAILKS